MCLTTSSVGSLGCNKRLVLCWRRESIPTRILFDCARFCALSEIAERQMRRRSDIAADWKEFGDKLRLLGHRQYVADVNTRSMTSISSGYLAGQDRWSSSQTTLKYVSYVISPAPDFHRDLGNHMQTISDRCLEQVCTLIGTDDSTFTAVDTRK